MKDTFRPPKSGGIIGRKSTITSEFVRALIPTIYPTPQEFEQALDILGQKKDQLECSYCEGTYTEWDHLRPVVENRKPTGYITNIQNLVPSCGKCNQSKGNKYWRTWMFGTSKLSPKSRKIQDLDTKALKLKRFEEWGNVEAFNFETSVTAEQWRQHWDNLDQMVELMTKAQSHAVQLQESIKKNYSTL